MSHWNYFFENIISGIQLFYIRPDAPAEFLFSFRFSSRKSQSQQKLAKKISHFTIQFRSKNVTDPTNLNSIGIENNMFSQHSQKSF